MSHTAEYPLHTLAPEPRHQGAHRARTPRTGSDQPVSTEVRTPHTEETIPFTLLVVLIVGASAVAAVAMAASSFSLAALGTAIGWVQWRGWLAWALPVSVDLLAAVAGLAWLAKGVADQARRLARTITLIAVAVSVLLNAISHLVESGDVHVGPWLRIAVSTVPPIVAAVGLHLIVTVIRTCRVAPTAAPAPAPRPTERQPAPADTAEEPPVYEAPAFAPAAPPRPLPEPVRTLVAEAHTEVRTQVPAVEAPAPAPAEQLPVEPEATTQEPTEAPAWWVQPDFTTAETETAEAPVPTPVRTHLTEVRTTPDQGEEQDDTETEEQSSEVTDLRRRILDIASEGVSQREVARRAGCSATYVRKVLDSAAA